MGLKARGGAAAARWADSVRARLARLRALDTTFRVHGASHHRYELAPPLDAATVAAFERTERVRLPAAYRRFVLEVGNGGAGPGYGMYGLAEARDGAGWIDGLKDLARVPVRDDGFRRHLLLTHHGCGSFSFLTLSGIGRGQVWWGEYDPAVQARSFDRWYEHWLDGALSQSAERERVRLDKVRAVEDQVARDGESAPALAAMADLLDVPATRERALRCRQRAHELAPDSYRVARALARALGALDRHEEAIAVCRATLPRLTDARQRAELLHLAGLSLALLRRVDDATATLAQARALAPKLRMGQALAVTAFHRGEPAEALELLRQAPIDAWSLHLRGLCHGVLGDLDQAAAYFRQCIERRTPAGTVAAAEANLAALERNRSLGRDGADA